MYGVNSVLASGVIDPGGNDISLFGVDEFVCGVNSVMTASELNVCGCDSVVSDEAGKLSVVEVVVSSDDAVRVGGCLSVVGDTLLCGAGVARSDRAKTEVAVGPVTVQPGWVDGLLCADGSLLSEPPPMHAISLNLMLMAAAR